MALRDQPYLPLYVQDYLTDEKLNMCSPATQGIYIKIMCVFHKLNPYGGILLKQKDKQTESICYNFAVLLARHLPFSTEQIESAIKELLDEKVLDIENDFLFQKRMVSDNRISTIRSEVGSKGGFASAKRKAKGQAKQIANPEDEDNSIIKYKSIIDNYNSLCNKLPSVLKLSDQRKKHLNARIAEFGEPKIIEVFRRAGQSDFLNGKNERAWKADFDWLINPNNFLKVIEGKFENKSVPGQKTGLSYIPTNLISNDTEVR
jgi:hypothetical protein